RVLVPPRVCGRLLAEPVQVDPQVREERRPPLVWAVRRLLARHRLYRSELLKTFLPEVQVLVHQLVGPRVKLGGHLVEDAVQKHLAVPFALLLVLPVVLSLALDPTLRAQRHSLALDLELLTAPQAPLRHTSSSSHTQQGSPSMAGGAPQPSHGMAPGWSPNGSATSLPPVGLTSPPSPTGTSRRTDQLPATHTSSGSS